MPKHYKEMIDEIINKMDEGFKVKYAMSPNQKIAVASYKSKSDAEKFKNDIKNRIDLLFCQMLYL